MDLVSFSVLPLNKHIEKDGWQPYHTKKKLEQVLENLRCLNALLEAEIEQVKCRLSSNQHAPQVCGKLEWTPDISAILPVECIAHILSFTSPLDACRLSLVCRAFCVAAAMDAVWERFLPSNYIVEIPCTITFSSTKEKFYYLCHKPVYVDASYMQHLILDRQTGKKCLVVWASLCRKCSTGQRTYPLCLGSMDGIESKRLSPKTAYVAYLVYVVGEESFGFDKVPLEILVHHEGGGGGGVCLDLLEPPEAMDQMPRMRQDGFKEIVMGEFLNDNGADGSTIWWCLRKRAADIHEQLDGLKIKEIEFRPKHQEVAADPSYVPAADAPTIFSQQVDCSRTVTSQYEFVHRTEESQISSKATRNQWQTRAVGGEEHGKLHLHKIRKDLRQQELEELTRIGISRYTSSLITTVLNPPR